MYGEHSSLAATGLPAAGGAAMWAGVPLGWALMAVFVLGMAAVALVAMAPRRVAEVRKVNPASLRAAHRGLR